MKAYTGFAEGYDLFMNEVPYEEWADYVVQILRDNGINDGLILDLGCGTGKFTSLLANKGYDMIGVDYSEDMLAIARGNNKNEILYLLQDMREFELYGTIRAVVCVCDSLNYILEYDELVQVFSLVNNYLDPNGLFIFDMNMEYKYKEIIGETVIAENRDEGSFIWENYYDDREHINEYDLTLFMKESNGKYSKYNEIHYQKAYSIEVIKKAIDEAGLTFIAGYDAATKVDIHSKSERIYVIARERGKIYG
jgi:Predicted methyltransferase (contains TPR repeat)